LEKVLFDEVFFEQLIERDVRIFFIIYLLFFSSPATRFPAVFAVLTAKMLKRLYIDSKAITLKG
jgi:hypothetical protein